MKRGGVQGAHGAEMCLGQLVPAEYIKRCAEGAQIEKRGRNPLNNELYRNGSGYIDPTAYAAINNYIQEIETMKFKKGEIYEFEMRSGNRTKTGNALIISDNLSAADKFVNLIVLSETRPKHDYLMIGAAKNTVAEIVCNGKAMYADCRIISYGDITRFGAKIGDAYPEDMRELDRCLCHSLGIGCKIERAETPDEPEKPTQKNDCQTDLETEEFAAEKAAFRAEVAKLAEMFSEFSENVRSVLYGADPNE